MDCRARFGLDIWYGSATLSAREVGATALQIRDGGEMTHRIRTLGLAVSIALVAGMLVWTASAWALPSVSEIPFNSGKLGHPYDWCRRIGRSRGPRSSTLP